MPTPFKFSLPFVLATCVAGSAFAAPPSADPETEILMEKIEDKFADIIDAMYDGSATVSTTTEVTYEDGRKGAISATLDIRDAAVVAMATKMAAE